VEDGAKAYAEVMLRAALEKLYATEASKPFRPLRLPVLAGALLVDEINSLPAILSTEL
jgi:hypothetical protein